MKLSLDGAGGAVKPTGFQRPSYGVKFLHLTNLPAGAHLRLLAWAPAAVWSLAILFLTSIPNPSLDVPPNSDKVAHFAVYAILGLLCARAAKLRRDDIATLLALIAGISLFGAIDEAHQYFIPGRSPAVDDWMADSLGGIAGATVVMLAAFRRRAGA